MLHRFRIFIVSTLVMLMVFTTMISSAQEQTPPLPGSDDTVSSPLHKAPPEADVSLTDAPPEEVADAVANTVAFRESLSQKQVAAIQAIITEHQPRLQEIARNIPAPDDQLTEDESAERTTNADAAAALQQSLVDLSETQAAIDAELMDVLTPEQQAMWEANTASFRQDVQEIANQAEQAAAPQSDSDCYYGAYYGNWALYYGYYGYIYGYYDYITADDDNNYAFYNYYYNYLGYYYAKLGFPFAAAAYFDSYYGSGSDSNDWAPNEAYDYFSDAAYYFYWGSYYGYYSWYYHDSTYGYYGYYYCYYGYYYANLATNYLTVCS